MNQKVLFKMDLNGHEVIVILQNPNFLAQLITEGMKLAMDNFLNHQWVNNVMNPLAPAVAPLIYHNIQHLWGMPSHFNPILNPTINQNLSFFSPIKSIQENPMFFPWIRQNPPMTVPSQNPTPSEPPLENISMGTNEVPYMLSFTEIADLREVALMLSPEMEDKKYIFKCPPTLKKCSIDIRPPINRWAAKLAVMVTPTIRTMPLVGQDQEMPSIYQFIMNTNPTLITWNIQVANNVAFRRNMKDLLITHTPCILALLEIKMESHEFLKNDYNFTGMVESPAGRSGITGMRQTFQELHVMVEVLPNKPPWLMSIIYFNPNLLYRDTLWNNLINIKDNYDGP
ncbi:hypothetical protein R3W88_011552 [Solanum pinnatisectum]|uniref:Uncharacterized protein n=1 Tax=Solanum pinnatisectum TaxID=50273 RepID=A0AAV9L7M0_9SOLN|nr:hypothetical protein R3W88_011552 [Solanum pinnatisectum]